MNNQTDFSQAITENNARFADLANKAMSAEVNQQNHSLVTCALITIALGGFITRRLEGIRDSLANATSTAGSTDPEEAAVAKLILSSNEEVGRQWQSLSTEFLSVGEGLLAGVVPEANTDGLPVFAGQFIDSALVANRMNVGDMNDPKTVDNFKAMQYAKIGNFIYGILVEDGSALGKIRRDADIGQVYDKFDEFTLDKTFQIDPAVILPVLFYIANQAEALVEKAKALVPFAASL